MRQPCALVMAGGTGGHIFPGLAMAEALRARGWRVHWLGVPGSMEERLVPPRGFAFEPVEFGGVRGKGFKTLLALPLRLARALAQARRVIRRVQPDVVLGLGGYITVPGGLAARLAGVPILLSLEIVQDTAGNAVIADAIVQSRQEVLEGIPLSTALASKRVFPELAVSMLAIGEETGQMDAMLSKVADFYEDEVEAAVKALTAMLEPAMIVIVGGIVGSILLAMYLPMFSIFDQIK